MFCTLADGGGVPLSLGRSILSIAIFGVAAARLRVDAGS